MMRRRTDGLLGFAVGVALCLSAIVSMSSAGVPIGRVLDGLTLIAVDAKRPDIVIERSREPGPAAKSAETDSRSITVICERCRPAPEGGGREREEGAAAAGPETSAESGGGDPGERRDTADAGSEVEQTGEGVPVERPQGGAGRVDITLSGLPSPQRQGLTDDPPSIEVEAKQDGRTAKSLEFEVGRSARLSLPAGVWDLEAKCSAMRRSGRLEGVVVEAGATISVSLPMELEPDLAIVLLSDPADLEALGFSASYSDSELEVMLLPVGIGPVSSAGELLDKPDSSGLSGDTSRDEHRIVATYDAPPAGQYLLLVRYGFGRAVLSEVIAVRGSGQEIIRELPAVRPEDMLVLTVRSSGNKPVKDALLDFRGTVDGIKAPLSVEVEPGCYSILFPTLYGAAARLASPWVLKIEQKSIPDIRLPMRPETGQRTVLAAPGATIRVQVEGLPRDGEATVYLTSAERWHRETIKDGVATIENVASGVFNLSVKIDEPLESSSELVLRSVRVAGDESLTVRVPHLHALSVRTDLAAGTLLRLVRPGSVLRGLVSGGAVHFRHLIAAGDWQLDGDARSELPRRAISIPAASPVEYRWVAADQLAVRVTGPGYLRDQGFMDGDRVQSIAGRPVGEVLETDPIWDRAQVPIVVDRSGRQVQLQADPRRLTSLEAHLGGAFALPSE